MKPAILAILCLLMPAVSARAEKQDPAKREGALNCRAISERAKGEKTKLLLIGVEGLIQYKGGDAQALYTYRQLRRRGQDVSSLPQLNSLGGGLLTRGLMFPLMREFGARAEVLMFGEAPEGVFRGSSHPAHECASIWLSVPGRSVIIFGHSFGAYSATDLAQGLVERGRPVAGLFTLDGMNRGSITRPAGVKHMENFYGTNPASVRVSGADRNDQINGGGHMKFPSDPAIFRAVADFINTTLREGGGGSPPSNKGPTKYEGGGGGNPFPTPIR